MDSATKQQIEALARQFWPDAVTCEVKQSSSFQWSDIPGKFTAWAVVAHFKGGRDLEAVKAISPEELKAKLEQTIETEDRNDE